MAHWTDFHDPDQPDGAYLPWKKVEPRVGISRTTAWRLQKTGDFPKPYVVSPGRVAYRESEVEAWKASRGHRSAVNGRTTTLIEKPPEAPSVAPEPSSWTSPVAAESAAAPPLPADRAAVLPAGGPTARTRRKPPKIDQMTFDF